MIIKRLPSDFQVDEITAIVPTAGDYAFYRLRKSGWTTLDAMAQIRKRWRLPTSRIAFGGLKDRHAETAQFFTVFRGPRRNLQQQGLAVQYLGQVASAYQSRDLLANRFRLVVRKVAPSAAERVPSTMDEIKHFGVPNYFDDQRFGFLSAKDDFFAKLIIHGQLEAALRVALTRPYEHDSSRMKREKRWITEHWGAWATVAHQAKNRDASKIAEHLMRSPGDFRGAVLLLRRDLCVLWLSAYQSFLWNEMLALWIRQQVPIEARVDLPARLGPLPAFRKLAVENVDLRDRTLPFPHHQIQWPQGDFAKPLMEQVLQSEGMTQEGFRLHGLSPLFFSKGERHMFCHPKELTAQDAPDELYPGFRKWTLAFALPPGSYATLIVKRLMGADDSFTDTVE